MEYGRRYEKRKARTEGESDSRSSVGNKKGSLLRRCGNGVWADKTPSAKEARSGRIHNGKGAEE